MNKVEIYTATYANGTKEYVGGANRKEAMFLATTIENRLQIKLEKLQKGVK